MRRSRGEIAPCFVESARAAHRRRRARLHALSLAAGSVRCVSRHGRWTMSIRLRRSRAGSTRCWAQPPGMPRVDRVASAPAIFTSGAAPGALCEKRCGSSGWSPRRSRPRSLNSAGLTRRRRAALRRAPNEGCFMRTSTGQPIRLADYRAPDYLVDAVELDVSLDRACDARRLDPDDSPQSGRPGGGGAGARRRRAQSRERRARRRRAGPRRVRGFAGKAGARQPAATAVHAAHRNASSIRPPTPS